MQVDKVLAKIHALLERADHPSTPPAEAQSCRERADMLMFKYQVDEALAAKHADANGLNPEWLEFPLCDVSNEFRDSYGQIANVVRGHVGNLRGVTDWKDGQYIVKLVGYRSDLAFFQTLLTQVNLEFSKRLEPKYDLSLTDAENAYVLRNGGMERRRIADALWGKLPYDATLNEEKARNRKVTKLIKQHCAAIGEDASQLLGRSGASMKTYRRDYADAFCGELHRRMYNLRNARGETERALALVSRKEAVDEAFYTEYPYMRPTPEAERQPYKDPRQDCERCRKAKSGYCREHAYLKPRASRYSTAFSGVAYEKGKEAARAVNLGPSGPSRAPSADRTAIGG